MLIVDAQIHLWKAGPHDIITDPSSTIVRKPVIVGSRLRMANSATRSRLRETTGVGCTMRKSGRSRDRISKAASKSSGELTGAEVTFMARLEPTT